MNTIQFLIERSEQSLKDADLLFKASSFNTSASLSYYAVFYAMEALLETKELNAKTHQGVLSLFSKHFIKTGIFPKSISVIIQKELEKRLIGDYEIGHGIDSDLAKSLIDDAASVVEILKIYLIQNNFLKND